MFLFRIELFMVFFVLLRLFLFHRRGHEGSALLTCLRHITRLPEVKDCKTQPIMALATALNGHYTIANNFVLQIR